MTSQIKRSDSVVEILKSWINDKRLRPGDRLPQEKELIDRFGMSKGTIREALKALETQGLVKLKTGPGGGAFVADVTTERAMSLLTNYFFFQNLTIRNIYELRIELEPQMAVSLVGHLKSADLDRLKQAAVIYSSPLGNQPEVRQQWLDEFVFHEVMADLCTNPVLSFMCSYLISLLKNLAVVEHQHGQPHLDLLEKERYYQLTLYDALRREDAEEVRLVLRRHMIVALDVLIAQQVSLQSNLLADDKHKTVFSTRH